VDGSIDRNSFFRTAMHASLELVNLSWSFENFGSTLFFTTLQHVSIGPLSAQLYVGMKCVSQNSFNIDAFSKP
jgi:hypothetical protein